MDGKPVRYVGTIKETGNLLVAVTYPNIRGHILTNVKAHTALEIRFPSGGKFANSTSGDDLRNKVIEKTVWKNVYSDGTIGATEHESLIATWNNRKDRKRVGEGKGGAIRVESGGV